MVRAPTRPANLLRAACQAIAPNRSSLVAEYNTSRLRYIVATVAAGVVLHAILMGSLIAFLRGLIGSGALDAIQ